MGAVARGAAASGAEAIGAAAIGAAAERGAGPVARRPTGNALRPRNWASASASRLAITWVADGKRAPGTPAAAGIVLTPRAAERGPAVETVFTRAGAAWAMTLA